MSNSGSTDFGPLRTFFWPIHRHETKKMVAMFFMLFLICLSYSILRGVKDALVVTAKASGAEVIPFIKLWVMLPAALLMTSFFTKLTNRFSQERVFYSIITGFLIFFVVFACFIYPLRDFLHPNESADLLQSYLPKGLSGFVAMYRNWTFTLFYVVAELWGCIVLTVLFWSFANQVTLVSESSRFYGVLAISANLAAIAAGLVSVACSNLGFSFFGHPISFASYTFLGDEPWQQSMNLMIMIVFFAGAITMAIFRWLTKNVSLNTFGKTKKKKEKLSLRESFRYLSKTPYVLSIATLVVSYNLAINLAELIWKAQLRELYPNPNEFNSYMNWVTTAIGVISTITSFFMAYTIRRLGWTGTALITPVMMMIMSSFFFSFLLFQDHLSGLVFAFGTTPLAVAVFVGGCQYCMSKAGKYSLFDATKEMAFVPLDDTEKLKGKAAIDGVGSRLGKSGGSLLHQLLLVFCGTISQGTPYIACILLVVIGAWIFAVKYLGKEYLKVSNVEEKQDLQAV